jgi:TonB family protein
MFHTLLESRAQSIHRRRRWTVASASLHAAIVTAVVAVTMPDEPTARIFAAPEPIVRWVSPRPAPTLRETPPCLCTRALPFVPTIPDLPPVAVAPDVETSIDVVAILAREGERPGISSTNTPSPQPGSVLTAQRVDREVVPLSGNGAPGYPAMLRASSIEGEVVTRFVVDTLGRVELSSVSIAASTHALFADAVRRWLVRTRYRPAEYEGRVVRQLVEQRIEFALRR